MPIDTAIKDIASNILQYINDNDMSNGLVILVDMGSLTDIYSEFNKASISLSPLLIMSPRQWRYTSVSYY